MFLVVLTTSFSRQSFAYDPNSVNDPAILLKQEQNMEGFRDLSQSSPEIVRIEKDSRDQVNDDNNVTTTPLQQIEPPSGNQYTYSLSQGGAYEVYLPKDRVDVLESDKTDTQLVITRPNDSYVVEKGYQIAVRGMSAILTPIDQLSQEYEKPGDLIGRSVLTVKAPNGPMGFTIEMRTGGLIIEPTSIDAASFVEQYKIAVIGAGALEVISRLGIPADMVRTIFINIPESF